MKSSSIETLLGRVRAALGADGILPYADSPDDPHGTCFLLNGVPAMFSVLTNEGSLPEGQYDIQVEDYPLMDYLYMDVVTLDRFMEVLSIVSTRPKAEWPVNSGSGTV